jgi:DNA-directed RNA polymerase specialized sigma24 family protein
MPTAEEFDEFYVSTRRRLVHQTFAVTGDLGASRTAVRDAYVAARHHWDKVGRMPEPEHWVRPRAWAIAQRRHSTRPWHKEKGVSPEQATLLDALHKLTDVQRKTLVLNHLAAIPMSQIGREIGETRERTENHLQTATAALALTLDGDTTTIRPRLESLAELTDEVKLPRPPVIRRSGLRRRRNHAVIGSVLAVLVTIGAGALVRPDSGTAEATLTRPGALVSKKMLLTADQVAPLAPKQPWAVTATSDNTSADAIETMCQGARFADTHGLGAWVRTFATAKPARSLTQAVEISNSPGAAKKAYDTTLGWYAGCTVPRIQLVDAYDVSGLGEQAIVLRMLIPAKQPRAFVIGIARTGSLTTSTVLETHDRAPVDPARVVSTLTTSVQNLCASRVAGTCVGAVTSQPTLPPPSGETPGMLAIADLPVVADVASAWAGTDPVPATANLAATTCDKTDFAKAGATRPVTRTYLIPEANLPKRFGLTETLGEFANPQAAAGVAAKIAAKMKSCPDRELGSSVSHAADRLDGPGGASYAMWRLEVQVNQEQELVPFWMGVAQVGRYVAQVTMTPVGKYDVDQKTFEALLVRARDRLHEVSP